MAENQNPYSKPSPEEQELWWKEGMKGKNFQRLYNTRIAKREAWNNKNGIITTYKSEESNLPEIVITAPEETEKQKLAKEQERKENLINLAVTGIGFIPGLDTVADIADFGNSWRKGDYSGMLWSGLGLGLPISGKVLKTGYNFVKNIPHYYKIRKVAKSISKSISDRIKAEDYNLKRAKELGLSPLKFTISGRPVGLPEKDPTTFYHYGKLPIKDGKIIPLPGFDGQEGRIWWNQGNVPISGDQVLVTKSKLVNENVLEHPEKYSPYRGSYLPSYYTSGAIPIDEVKVYNRNPFTGNYDSTISYTSSVINYPKTADFSKAYFNMQLLE